MAQIMMQQGNPNLSSRMSAHGMLRSLVMAMMRNKHTLQRRNLNEVMKWDEHIILQLMSLVKG
jgi:hypothetical protein